MGQYWRSYQKALDTLNKDLLLAKLYAYCFEAKALQLVPIEVIGGRVQRSILH